MVIHYLNIVIILIFEISMDGDIVH